MHYRGFLTIELLLAIMFFTLTMAGVFMVASEGQTMRLDVGLSSGGVGAALSSIQRKTQEASALAGFGALSDESDTSGFYAKTSSVQTVSPCIKAIRHETAWESENNRALSVDLATLVASIETATLLDGGCDPIPPTDWENPDSLASVDIGGAPATGIVARSIDGDRIIVVIFRIDRDRAEQPRQPADESAADVFRPRDHADRSFGIQNQQHAVQPRDVIRDNQPAPRHRNVLAAIHADFVNQSEDQPSHAADRLFGNQPKDDDGNRNRHDAATQEH